MAKLDYDYFRSQFERTDTEQLIQNAVSRDLVPQASAALFDVLRERGIEGERLELAVVDAKRAILSATGATNECDFCGATVLFGAIYSAAQKFCSDACERRSRLTKRAVAIAHDLVVEHAYRIITGPCPRCQRTDGTVEFRRIHLCVSLLFICWHEPSDDLSCRRCAVVSCGMNSLASLLFGWWSIPGLLFTPLAIVKNAQLAIRDRFDLVPTQQLLNHAALELADRPEFSLADDPMQGARRHIDDAV
jgi:endogenous inhibitor of DNA gyrase (YacG/DUF329 family)